MSSGRGRARSTGSIWACEPGEIYGFLGPNGAGKSTTVLMLTTLLPPTSGSARVAGFDVQAEGPKVRATIGAALQEAALDPLLTGREHLRLQATLQALPRGERKARAHELLERVGLTEAADRRGARLLGRHEAPPRPRSGADPPAAGAVPRRADDRPRRSEPHRALAGGGEARPRGRRDRLPHHAVPRGGRRAGEPRRDHRPRPHRRRGHARRTQGRGRPAHRGGGPLRPGRPGSPRRGARPLRRPRPVDPRRRRAAALRRDAARRARARPRRRDACTSRTSSSTSRRSTTSSSPRQAARSRAPARKRRSERRTGGLAMEPA